jgi:hypothetical protein
VHGGSIIIMPLLAAGCALAAAPLDGVIDRARSDAARRTGVPASSIQTLTAESVAWPDGSLGCPRPGMGYTQALVPGYRIRLRARGQVLDYHAGSGGVPVFCPASRSVDPIPDESR